MVVLCFGLFIASGAPSIQSDWPGYLGAVGLIAGTVWICIFAVGDLGSVTTPRWVLVLSPLASGQFLGGMAVLLWEAGMSLVRVHVTGGAAFALTAAGTVSRLWLSYKARHIGER